MFRKTVSLLAPFVLAAATIVVTPAPGQAAHPGLYHGRHHHGAYFGRHHPGVYVGRHYGGFRPYYGGYRGYYRPNYGGYYGPNYGGGYYRYSRPYYGYPYWR